MQNYPNLIRDNWKPDETKVAFPEYEVTWTADRRSDSDDIDTHLPHLKKAAIRAHLISQHPSGIWKKSCAQMLFLYARHSPEFACYNRLLSYNTTLTQFHHPLVDVHSLTPACLQPRELNVYEKKLYKFYNPAAETQPMEHTADCHT